MFFRKPYCPKGHLKNPSNLYGRRCRICHLASAKKYRPRHKGRMAYLCKRWRKLNRTRSNRWAIDYYGDRKAFMWSLKSNPCVDCKKWFHPWQMQFDHLPGHEKIAEVNAAWCHSDIRLFNEIAKCQLVCSNCHENRSYHRRYANGA